MGDLNVVVEVKTTDAYTIATNTLLGYVDRLITARKIPDWEHALGLYVVGRADAALRQLQNAIVAEHNTQRLRVATVDTILSLAELVQDRLLTSEEAVALLRPVGVLVDDTVRLIARVASQATAEAEEKPGGTSPGETTERREEEPGARVWLMTPVSDDEEGGADDSIRTLLDRGWYVFGDRTPGRKNLKPGDRLCFYHSGVGVVAEAEVSTAPERKSVPVKVHHPEDYPWRFKVKNPRYFFDKPIVIDAALRAKLDAFKNRDPESAWAWLVQGTRIVTEHDFHLLTGASG
jgi:hypothetical protein